MISSNQGGTATPDPFFPSQRFAKVPAELLTTAAHSGPAKLSHAEFRVFVALCRFRGPSRLVNPTRATLQRMTGMVAHNISRATGSLQRKGWLTVHYVPGRECQEVENYELHLPTAICEGAKAPLAPSEESGA